MPTHTTTWKTVPESSGWTEKSTSWFSTLVQCRDNVVIKKTHHGKYDVKKRWWGYQGLQSISKVQQQDLNEVNGEDEIAVIVIMVHKYEICLLQWSFYTCLTLVLHCCACFWSLYCTHSIFMLEAHVLTVPASISLHIYQLLAGCPPYMPNTTANFKIIIIIEHR